MYAFLPIITKVTQSAVSKPAELVPPCPHRECLTDVCMLAPKLFSVDSCFSAIRWGILLRFSFSNQMHGYSFCHRSVPMCD